MLLLLFFFIFLSMKFWRKKENIPPLIYWNSCVIVGYSHTPLPWGYRLLQCRTRNQQLLERRRKIYRAVSRALGTTPEGFTASVAG